MPARTHARTHARANARPPARTHAVVRRGADPFAHPPTDRPCATDLNRKRARRTCTRARTRTHAQTRAHARERTQAEPEGKLRFMAIDRFGLWLLMIAQIGA